MTIIYQISGRSLEQLFQQKKSQNVNFAFEEIVEIFYGCLDGLEFLISKGFNAHSFDKNSIYMWIFYF